MNKALRSEGGFTLFEVIVSLAIISIALVTLMSVFNRAIASAAETSALTDAVMIAEEKISLLDASSGLTAGSGDWQDESRYPGYKWRRIVTVAAFYNVDVYMVELQVRRGEKDIFSLVRYVKKG